MIRATYVTALAALSFTVACGSSSSPVQPPPSQGEACPTGSTNTTVSLAVGQVSALTNPSALDCVTLATTGGGGGSFLVVVGNADAKPDVVGQYELTFGVPAVNDVATPGAPLSGALGALGARVVDTRSVAEGRFRARARRALHLDQPRVFAAAAIRMRARSTQVSRAVVPAVGDTLAFNVPDATASNACTTFTAQKAVVKAVGTHGIILQDTQAPAGGFSSGDFQSIEAEFDNTIYPTDTTHFGSPSDFDNDGHVYLLFTPKVNAATKRGSNSILEGFFFAGDLFLPSDCAESNESELFYLLVPDPTGTFSDARSTDIVRQDIRGTIAHEFQHMINAGVRINTLAPDETVWLNEGLSHMAEEFVGRAEDDFTDTQELNINDVADFPSLNNFDAFFGQNMARLREWMLSSGRLGATSGHADTSLAVRGAAWSLLRWTADHYAGGNVAAFTRALVAGPDTGVANLTARAGVPFDSLAAGWLPALYADGDGIAGLPARYTFLSWDIRNIEAAVNQGDFPLTAHTLNQSQETAGSVGSASGRYYLVSVPASGTVVFGELDPSGTAVTYPGAQLYIVRLQ